MIDQLNWDLLCERRRLSRLVMFYNIQYHLVAISMPLTSLIIKHHPEPTRKENTLAYITSPTAIETI